MAAPTISISKTPLAGLTQYLARSGLNSHVAHARAYATIYGGLQAQAATMAYVDAFMVLAVGSAIMFFDLCPEKERSGRRWGRSGGLAKSGAEVIL